MIAARILAITGAVLFTIGAVSLAAPPLAATIVSDLVWIGGVWIAARSLRRHVGRVA